MSFDEPLTFILAILLVVFPPLRCFLTASPLIGERSLSPTGVALELGLPASSIVSLFLETKPRIIFLALSFGREEVRDGKRK